MIEIIKQLLEDGYKIDLHFAPDQLNVHKTKCSYRVIKTSTKSHHTGMCDVSDAQLSIELMEATQKIDVQEIENARKAKEAREKKENPEAVSPTTESHVD